MHDEHGPRRLRQGNDTPEALLRAIDALRKGVDDSARLSRVGQKLERALNAPPTAAQPQPDGLFGHKLSTLKLILGGLAVLVALTPLWFRQHSDDRAVPGADHDGSPAAPANIPAAQPQAEEVAQPTVESAVPETAPAAPSAPARRASKHAARARERTSVREANVERAPSDQAVETHVDTAQAPAAASSKELSPSSAAKPSESPKEAQQLATKPEQAKEAPPVPAEADLLLKARKALKLDPSSALRLATEHQTYYPKGRLAPEREVLAIEALRSLGRKQEAAERLKLFEARYPKSIHLQRLHEGM